MAYSITVTRVQNLHETLKQIVKEINEFAWDMRQSGLGVLMPEEIEIKVTVLDEDSGTFQEIETMAGGEKTTTANTTEQKGTATEAVDITETDVAKVSTQTENSPIMIERSVDTSIDDTTTTIHGDEVTIDDMSGMTEQTTFGEEVTVDTLTNDTTTTVYGPEITKSESGSQSSTSSTNGADRTQTQYTYL